jgi:hypothetical protein
MGERRLGETARGRVIGKNSGDLFVWVACDTCKEERWVTKPQYDRGQAHLCRSCASKLPKVKAITPQMAALGVKELRHGGYALHVLVDCPKCGQPRWRRWQEQRHRPNAICRKCNARSTQTIIAKRSFKGVKKTKHCSGYVMVWLPHDHLFRGMASKTGYVMQHRLAVAESLNRPLLTSEHVHHKNGIKTDNRLENLQLISPTDHRIYTELCADCSLRKEIRLLRWELKEMRAALQEKMTL